MKVEDLRPSERTEALYAFFGWQGGTAHELALVIGVKEERLLYGPCKDRPQPNTTIWTTSVEMRQDIAKRTKKNWPFWVSVILGYWEKSSNVTIIERSKNAKIVVNK